ncbi:hypothetical protein TBLA_0E01360 [Henningerozyma blattae CBS 6284]|uniref:Uncharacterized protein n=1 Tax=Henningerozyma blattae (strain ATCC 34711 / CBS 6284 / DSM 70876 / NBRC 10599 / NRRL Y-10934 / UCD 77-7) TaxID=1071380 RepID=I2H493_HENB6|nr:hypothetical protein TBLA_0E01360 [Tetrapisispora blattae CBS 6284]CCH61195.1 hypothetical protein TBLA_0E01360 [Tetrapisispora blattae CBS 6284]
MSDHLSLRQILTGSQYSSQHVSAPQSRAGSHPASIAESSTSSVSSLPRDMEQGAPSFAGAQSFTGRSSHRASSIYRRGQTQYITSPYDLATIAGSITAPGVQQYQAPIQEIIPNTQDAVYSQYERVSVAPPTTRLSKKLSLLTGHVPEEYEMDDQMHHYQASTTTGGGASRAAPTIGQQIYTELDLGGDAFEPIPMMVKTKTLHQNPQTPTVLPSTYRPINRWAMIRHTYLREFLAEFLGTMMMMVFGDGICCQVNLGAQIQKNQYENQLITLQQAGVIDSNTVQLWKTLEKIAAPSSAGTATNIPLGWACGVISAYFSAGGSSISGAHLNPAITLVSAVFRGFPFRKIPIYFIGQFLGAFIGAYVVYAYHKRVIQEAYPDDWWKNQSVMSNFFVFPQSFLSVPRQFVSEFMSTAILLIGNFAMSDPYTCLSTELFPVTLFLHILVVNMSLSYQTGCAMNLVRDLGPRLALYTMGFERHMIWVQHHHFFWVPIVAPFFGALMGGLIYDVCVYQGQESPVNWPLAVYKEWCLRVWHKRPGYKTRLRQRQVSSFSGMSSFVRDDDLDHHPDFDGNMEEATPLAQPPMPQNVSATSTDPSQIHPTQKHVQFENVGASRYSWESEGATMDSDSMLETPSVLDSIKDGDATSSSGMPTLKESSSTHSST